MPEDDPFMVRGLIDHAYMLDYDSQMMTSEGEDETTYGSALLTDAKIYGLGEVYGMEGLKEEAKWKFQKHMFLAVKTMPGLNGLLETIPTIYETTPDNDNGLREYVVNCSLELWSVIKALPELKNIAPLVPEYWLAVARGMGCEVGLRLLK